MKRILSPHTGRTPEHQAMLLAVVRWLADQSVLQAAIYGGIKRSDLKLGLAAVELTLSGQDEGPVTPVKVAKLVLDLLERKLTRKTIIRLEVRRCGLGKRQAVQDIREIRLACAATVREAATQVREVAAARERAGLAP